MIICPKCGFVCREDGSFCNHCGFRYKSPEHNPVSEAFDPMDYSEDGSYPDEDHAHGKQGGKKNNHLSFGKPGDHRDDSDSPVTPHWESVPNMNGRNRRKKPVGPMVAGIIAVLVILGIGIFSYISFSRKIRSQENQINSYHSEIMTVCKRQREDYLESAVDLSKTEEFEKSADTIKNSENSQNQEKINRLRDLSEKLTEYDDELVKGQRKELDKAHKKLVKKREDLRHFMIAGEEETMNGYDTDFASHSEEKKFRSCSDDLEQMKSLSKKITDTSESKDKYVAGNFLSDGEFIPQTMEVLVDAASYTDQLPNDHFTLIEKIGGEDPQFLDVSVKQAVGEGSKIRYELYFKSANVKDYNTKRGYRLHVRNMDGSKGFELEQGSHPASLVKLAVKDKLEEFVEYFNRDCDEKRYNSLRNIVESGSQAEERLSAIPGSKEGEAIVDSDDDFHTFQVNADGTVFAKIRFTYELGQVKSYGNLRPEEESRVRKDVHIEVYEGKEYVIGMDGGEYVAEPLDEAHYIIHEKISELDSFTFRMSNNAVNDMIRYDYEDPEIIQVIETVYKPNPDNYISESDLMYMDDDDIDDY